MGLINPTLPTVGQPNSTEDVDVLNALTTIVNTINGGLDTANIAAAAGILGSQLETKVRPAAVLGHWRTIAEVYSGFRQSDGVIDSFPYPLIDGQNTVPANTVTTGAGYSAFYLDPADYLVDGLTAQFRLRAATWYGNPGLGTTITAALRTAGVSAGSWSTGVIAGMTVALANPGTDGRANGASSTVGPGTLTAGYYIFTGFLAAVPAASSGAKLWAGLQIKHV